MQSGQALAWDIDGCRPARGTCAFWWLGQHSFVIKAGASIVYLDPFLSDMPGRLVPPLLSAAEIRNATVICGTHDHADHIDRPAWPLIAKASPNARFVVPDLLLPGLARDLGIPADRFEGLDDGRSVRIGEVRVSAVAAAHEFLDRDPATGRYPYLGFVVEVGGFVFYHAGDSCVYEGLRARLKPWTPDVVFLPINGRDARRLSAGCIGNMTYQEAADLAGDLHPRLVVPAHYEMFEMNREDPEAFLSYMRVKYPAIPVLRCRHGEGVRFDSVTGATSRL